MDKKEEAAASASKTSMGIDLGTTNSCVAVMEVSSVVYKNSDHHLKRTPRAAAWH